MANPKLLLLALAFLPFAIASTSKPNIILFVIDDLGWNDTSYQGAEYSTPNIDKLAEEGIRLKQYYVQPLCSPSRSALMAGRYPYHLGLAHGVITNGHPFALSSDEVTIADRLRKGGYATHAVGEYYGWMSAQLSCKNALCPVTSIAHMSHSHYSLSQKSHDRKLSIVMNARLT